MEREFKTTYTVDYRGYKEAVHGFDDLESAVRYAKETGGWVWQRDCWPDRVEQKLLDVVKYESGDAPARKEATMRIAYKVKGLEGHRQSASFGKSAFWDFSKDGDVRKISVLREDILQTNDHVIVIIERNTAEECEAELNGQLSDGIFENCRVGGVEVLYGEEVELDDR